LLLTHVSNTNLIRVNSRQLTLRQVCVHPFAHVVRYIWLKIDLIWDWQLMTRYYPCMRWNGTYLTTINALSCDDCFLYDLFVVLLSALLCFLFGGQDCTFRRTLFVVYSYCSSELLVVSSPGTMLVTISRFLHADWLL